MELPKQYKPTDHESRIRAAWEGSGAFHPDPARVVRGEAKPYAIVIPPPNVTDRLHLGHALNNTLQDVLVRAHRMMGFETLWMPGTDHAGIATQAVVERRLRKEGRIKGHLKESMSRDEFIATVQAFKDEYEATITGQLKAMGCSCDWERQRFTMDEGCIRAVNEAFFRLFRDGLIYRGKRLVNWDPVTQTALADDEVEMEEVDGKFYYLRYPLVHGEVMQGGKPGPDDDQALVPITWSELRSRGYPVPDGPDYADENQAFVTVATTRPETYLGDTAVGVNPRDPRAKALRGVLAELPLVGRIIPIVEDDYVVMPKRIAEQLGDDEAAADAKAEFATGFLKVTPAHDPNDYELGRRHDLAVINVMAPDASISDTHGWSDVGDAHIFVGKGREEARKLVVKEFQARGLVEDIKPYRHSVGHSYRSHAAIEPYLSDQWYVKVTDERLAPAANAALVAEQRAHPCGAGVPPAASAASAADAFRAGKYTSSGVSPILSKRSRRLPHWERGGKSYAIGFRLVSGELSEPERQIVLDACVHWHEKRLVLYAATVMPDHVHLMIRPLEKEPGEWWSLAELMHSIKSFSSHEINKRRNTKATLWQDESYDHILRSSRDFDQQLWYIQNNPVKAGLADKPGHYRFTVTKPQLDELKAELAEEEAAAQGAAEAGGTPAPHGAWGALPGDGALRFYPARYAKMYESWHEGIRDWCISRQLWWGHQIPVWSKSGLSDHEANDACEDLRTTLVDPGPVMPLGGQPPRFRKEAAGNVAWWKVSDGDKYSVHACLVEVDDWVIKEIIEKGYGFRRDPDVLDTWFSSGLWPMSTMGWPEETPLLKAFNPTDVLCTAREIITLWVSRMVMFNRYFRGQDLKLGEGRGPLPFRDVFIHSVVQDGEGRKMSKSLGNGVDPLDIIASHGADAMRFTIVQMATHTQDVRMPVVKDAATGRNTSPKFDLGRNFCNKLWNAARFAVGILESETATGGQRDSETGGKSPLADRWMLSRLEGAVREVERALREYSYAEYAQAVYDLLWRDFCDWYLEAIKPTVASDAGQRAVLAHALEAIVRLLHPIMPFITEAIWERVREIEASPVPGVELGPSRKAGLLATAGWPRVASSLRDESAEREFESVRALVTAIREVRAQHNVPPKRRITLHVAGGRALTPETEALVKTLAVVGTVTTAKPDGESVPFSVEGVEHRLSDLTDVVDKGAEAIRLEKLIADLGKSDKTLEGRLANPGYAEKAPAAMVQQTRDQLAKVKAELAAAAAALKALKGS